MQYVASFILKNYCCNLLHSYWGNISNPTMRTGLDFKSTQFDQNARRSRGLDRNTRTWNLVQSELEDLKWHLMRINHYLINFDPVLGQDQYTSPGIQYYHVSKIRQYGWLIYSWIVNEFWDLSFNDFQNLLMREGGLPVSANCGNWKLNCMRPWLYRIYNCIFSQ